MRNSGIMLTGDEHFALIQKMNDLEWERDQALATVDRLKTEYYEALQMAANQASTIKQQIEEIERLRGASKFLDKNLDNYKRTLDARETNLERREAELDKLESEAERLREDAERYRWLRDNADMQFGPLNTAGIFQPTTLTHAEIDAAIDAAMGG